MATRRDSESRPKTRSSNPIARGASSSSSSAKPAWFMMEASKWILATIRSPSRSRYRKPALRASHRRLPFGRFPTNASGSRESSRKKSGDSPPPRPAKCSAAISRILRGDEWKKNAESLRSARRGLCRLQAEPYRRWAAGFSCLCFVWVGAPMAIRLRNRDMLTSFFLCFMPILIVYYPLLVLGVNGAKDGYLPPWSVWAGNLLMLAWGRVSAAESHPLLNASGVIRSSAATNGRA